jgi:DNA-binding CsgD family transcriptional regulator
MKEPSIPPLTGAAFYQKAELHRLRGEFAEAEEAYRQASQWGRNPQPGLALLRLGEGRLEAATRAILRAVEEAQDRTTRCRLLSAHVEIMLAAGDLDAARVATLELTRIAGDLGTPFLQAIASHSLGALLLAEGDLSGALAALRRTWDAWQAIEVPREAARIRVLIGRACRELGDEDTATLEFDAARRVFRQLGAAPDLHQLGGIVFPSSPEPAENLTPRQVEVLRHIAAGKTNREIAVALSISEKTVARHVSNILGELELPNRAAATAYAFQEGLV